MKETKYISEFCYTEWLGLLLFLLLLFYFSVFFYFNFSQSSLITLKAYSFFCVHARVARDHN